MTTDFEHIARVSEHFARGRYDDYDERTAEIIERAQTDETLRADIMGAADPAERAYQLGMEANRPETIEEMFDAPEPDAAPSDDAPVDTIEAMFGDEA